MVFYDFAKHQQTVSYTTFWSLQKSWIKYLIKPVVYWYFWRPFRKTGLKSIKKALGFSLKIGCVLRLCQNVKNGIPHASGPPPTRFCPNLAGEKPDCCDPHISRTLCTYSYSAADMATPHARGTPTPRVCLDLIWEIPKSATTEFEIPTRGTPLHPRLSRLLQ